MGEGGDGGLASMMNSYGTGGDNTIKHFYAGGAPKAKSKKKDVIVSKNKKKG